MHNTPGRIVAAAVTLLLLCVVHYTQEAHAVTTNYFTAEQRTHTARFLKGFLSGATELPSAWTGTDFCGWRGVSCPDATAVNVDLSGETLGSSVTLAELSDEVDGSEVMVRELRVANHGSLLRGTLPESWARLTQMDLLDLHGNALSGTLPSAWGSMTALRSLYMDENKLTGPLPPEWASMKWLRTILIGENLLSGPLPSSWGVMRFLERLDAERNSISGTLPAEWSGLEGLNSLMLGRNALSGTLPPEWGGLGSLSLLSLSMNHLSGSLPVSWGSLRGRASLYLNDNALCGCVPASWSALEVEAEDAMTVSSCAAINPCRGSGVLSVAQSNTLKFLRSFTMRFPELQSAWTGTGFCGWRGVTCVDATTVNVDLSGETLESAAKFPELGDDVDGSQVMVRELRVANHGSLLTGTLPESWSRLTQLRLIDTEANDRIGALWNV